MFNFRVYQKDGTFKFTINPKDVKNEISFTANYNWWQGQLLLLLNYSFENSQIENSDFIQIYKWSVLVYTWVCQKIDRVITNNFQEINIPLLWLWVIPTYDMFFKTGIWYSFTENKDPSEIVKDMINWLNTNYNWLSYDTNSIPLYWSNESFTFDYTNCFVALNTIAERIGRKWFIDKDGKVYFKPKDLTTTYKLTVWKNIESIELSQDSENLINNIRLKYDSGVNAYFDNTSMSTYWRRVKYIDKASYTLAQANTYWNTFINENKDPKNKTIIILNNNFNLESIKVLENITVKNFWYIINNLQIVKYTYSVDKIVLELEEFDSFGKELNL